MEESARQWRSGGIHLDAGSSSGESEVQPRCGGYYVKISAAGETPPTAVHVPRCAMNPMVGRHQRLGLRRRLESAGRFVEVERGDSGLKRVCRTMRASS